jgi:hypothetical protein
MPHYLLGASSRNRTAVPTTRYESIESAAARCESRRFSSSVDCGEASRRRARGRGGAGGAPRKRTQHALFCCGLLQVLVKFCSRFKPRAARRGNLSSTESYVLLMNEPPFFV